MATIDITNFGGEMPRVEPRSLPEGAAQVNSNLLATSVSFRPVMGPRWVAPATTYGSAVPAAKTLYRRGRNADGSYRTDDATGWFASGVDMSIVKGQLPDDTTERTYIAFNDGGITPPLASDMSNEGGSHPSYLLGVPPPDQPQVKLHSANYFTMDKAVAWRDNTFLPAIMDAITSNIVESRYTATGAAATSGSTTAGITSAHLREPFRFPVNNPRGISEPTNVIMEVPIYDGKYTAALSQLDDQRLGGIKDSQYVRLAFPASPLWGQVKSTNPSFTDQQVIEEKLKLIKNPRYADGSKRLWDNNTHITQIAAGLVALFSPTDTEVSALRAKLDALFEDFVAACYYAMVSTDGAPTHPGAEPTTAQFPGAQIIVNKTQAGGDEGGANSGSNYNTTEVKNQAYVDYERAHAVWAVANSAYQTFVDKIKADNAKRVSDAVTAQAAATKIVAQIEALYTARRAALKDTLTNNINTLGLARSETTPNGIVEVDPDKITQSTFWVCTYVTAWDEESAPSEISAMLDVGQNDAVTLLTPTIPSWGHLQIDRVRWYRSNTGTATAFQFAHEVPIAKTVRAPKSLLTGNGSGYVGVQGTADAVKTWVDQLASWVVADNSGVPTAGIYPIPNDDHLQPGDTVGLTNPDTLVTTIKTWTGSQWVLSGPAISVDVIGKAGIIDGKPNEALGEVCPTVEWLRPPTLMVNGVERNIQGLTGGPNGVMSAFIENMWCCCEPYVPYAWPVAYQVPIEFKIVGIGTFGPYWFLGTSGNPYLITGDSLSGYVSQKLDSSQSCVSRKSIVSTGGGCFYASPDGYCFADQSGAKVVTQALFANEDWRKLRPETIRAIIFDNVLYFWYDGNGGGCYGLDLATFKLTRHDLKAEAVFGDTVTDGVYAASEGSVYKLFYGDRMTGKWKSGNLVLPRHATLAWLVVWGDQTDSMPAIVRRYSGDTLLDTYTVTSTNPMRVKPLREIEYTIEVESKARITEVIFAGNTAELQGVQ